MFTRRVKKYIKPVTCFLIVALGVLLATQARAATIYLSPSFGSGSVGKTFSISVYVSSTDQAINAASGVVSFSNDKIEIVSVSKSGSIFNLWVAEPSFSQSAGTFSFEGIVLNPGYTGTGGKIISANFKVKAAGTAKLSFASGAVLANDGEGTNILSGFGSTSFNLVDGNAPKVTTPIELKVETPKPIISEPKGETPTPAGATPTPRISSNTNPDQEKWYASNTVKLSWSIPRGVSGLRLLLSSSANDTPTITYIPPLSSKEINNVDDGVYYFSARFKDDNGWGDIARYALRVDTKPPKQFTIGLPDGETTAKNQPSLKLATMDALSGLDYWLVKINDEPAITVRAEEITNDLYVLPMQSPGTKNIIVEAYDKAGNKTSASAKIEIAGETKGKNLALTSWPDKVTVGSPLNIKGKTSGINTITVYWQKDNAEIMSAEVISDVKGDFTFSTIIKDVGNYQVWAAIKDEQGLMTISSDKVSFVSREGLLKIIFSFLGQIWWLFVLLALGGLVYAFFQSSLAPGKHQHRQHIDRLLYNSLLLLRDGIKDQIKILVGAKSRRRLSKEELAVMEGLQKTLSNTDRFLAKEITIIKKKRQTTRRKTSR